MTMTPRTDRTASSPLAGPSMMRGPIAVLRHTLLLLLATMLALFAVPAAAQQSQPAPQGYVLGPNDGIAVRVYGQDEFTIQTRVKPDGSIVMPMIGRVQASGRNVIQLATDIENQLKSGNYLREPIVNIEISEYNSGYVRVAGRVGAPGLVPLDRSTNMLDVLLRAGWVRDDGSQYVLLRRASDGKEERIDTAELARGERRDIVLRSGDTLFVDKADMVFVTGQINRPGGYAITPGMTIAKLIAAAGGVTPTGSSGRVGLKRGAKETTVDDQTEVQKDDVINVRERLF